MEKKHLETGTVLKPTAFMFYRYVQYTLRFKFTLNFNNKYTKWIRKELSLKTEKQPLKKYLLLLFIHVSMCVSQ